MAICQDTGMCVIFLDVGQEVHIAGGSLQDALAEGVRQAYGEGYPVSYTHLEVYKRHVIFHPHVALVLDLIPAGEQRGGDLALAEAAHVLSLIHI